LPRQKVTQASAEPSAQIRLRAAVDLLHPAIRLCDWTLIHIRLENREEGVTGGEVKEAARQIFAAMQPELERIGEGVKLDSPSRQAVWSALTRADRALAAVEAKNIGKWIQRQAIGDREPLTVCIGRRARVLTGFIDREDSSWAEDVSFNPAGDGCGIVFRDSQRKFTRYCPECRKKPARYFERRAIAKRLAADNGRLLVPRMDMDGNRLVIWRATCRCGQTFETDEPRVRRCESCRRAHR
jgi:predicted Zn-ribbon and HTH transcriptional regulator